MSNYDKRTTDIARAIVESRSMEERAAYLRRGREHAGLTIEAAKDLWVASFKAWVNDRSRSRERVFADVNAEMDLRGEALPFERVNNEVETFREELLLAGPNSPELREAVVEFLKKLRAPRN